MASNSGASAIIRFAHSRTLSFMPRPWSDTSTTTPRATTRLVTSTGDPGGEKDVALSTSSATRWMVSATAEPTIATSATCSTCTRAYCSVSETAARSTSISVTGLRHRRPGCLPPRMIRFSVVRRARAARWSSWNSAASWVEFSSRLSISSRICSCRWTRTWFRCAIPRNTLCTPLRAFASLAAALTAVSWAALNASATCPISSRPWSSCGSSAFRSTGSPLLSRPTMSGSRLLARSSESLRSRASRVISARSTSERDTRIATMIATREASSARTLPMIALRSWASPESIAAAETLSAWRIVRSVSPFATAAVALCQSASATGTPDCSPAPHGPCFTIALSAFSSCRQAGLAVSAWYLARTSGSVKGTTWASCVR